MQSNKSEIILHNYPQSPVAEKVRVVLGIKGLSWHSVEIPRIPPKPMLTKLTGGYRRTPVMQIGADIYCDSHCIINALEHMYPAPTLFPSHEKGLMQCLSRWTGGTLFDLAVKIVLGSAGDKLPPDFAEDRGRLYFGKNWQNGLEEAGENIPHLVSQISPIMTWLDKQLSDGREFLLGKSPSAIDAQFYHIVWFLRGRWNMGPQFLSQFSSLIRWEKNITKLGHGTKSDITAEEAIAQATKYDPDKIGMGEESVDFQDIQIGSEVFVSPDVDGGEQPVSGILLALDESRITICRQEPDVGELNIHFPRIGYVVATH